MVVSTILLILLKHKKLESRGKYLIPWILLGGPGWIISKFLHGTSDLFSWPLANLNWVGNPWIKLGYLPLETYLHLSRRLLIQFADLHKFRFEVWDGVWPLRTGRNGLSPQYSQSLDGNEIIWETPWGKSQSQGHLSPRPVPSWEGHQAEITTLMQNRAWPLVGQTEGG